MISFALIEDLAELQGLKPDWDALAVQASAPFGAPTWALAWWKHLSPPKARLAVVAVRSDGELIGLAPFYATRSLGVTELRLLGGGWASRLGIVNLGGRREEVAKATAEALFESEARPDLIHWEGVEAASQDPKDLSAAWPGRTHRIKEESRRGAPLIDMSPSTYEDWLATKSTHFRKRMRRGRRKIEEEGAVFRFADNASLDRDLDSFCRLHSSRREGRGGSTAVSPKAMEALLEIGRELLGSGRFRLQVIDGPGGAAINAQLYVAAGETVAFWNAGFDESWHKHSPGILGVLATVEDAYERGEAVVDLGGGEAAYKDRLRDEDRPVAWLTSYPRGVRYPLARLRRLPGQLARSGSQDARRAIGPDRVQRLRGSIAGRGDKR